MGILDVNELTTNIMKSSVNMEYPSGMLIKAGASQTVLLSV